MIVQLIAKTETTWNPRKLPGKALDSKYQERAYQDMVKDYDGTKHNQEIIEFGGRLCYESFDLPGPNTSEQSTYIANIMRQKHLSVIEHASVTFYVEKVSRNLSHELIRHRHLSFSEISQRYVDMEDANFIYPPAFGGGYSQLSEDDVEQYRDALLAAELNDVKGKKAREAARYFLPAGAETKFVVTGNLRAWYDVLGKRRSIHADAEMRLFAEEIYTQLSLHYPDVFNDETC